MPQGSPVQHDAANYGTSFVAANATATMIGPNPVIIARNNRITPRLGEYYSDSGTGGQINIAKARGFTANSGEYNVNGVTERVSFPALSDGEPISVSFSSDVNNAAFILFHEFAPACGVI